MDLCWEAEDGWGDDTWGGFEASTAADGAHQLAANLR
jgi:hypothetical protein